MSPDQLVSGIRAQRMRWVDLPEGRRVRVLRPAESELRGFIRKNEKGEVFGIGAELGDVKRYVTDWSGFTEACLIGPAGAAEPVEFNADVWAAWVEDKSDVVALVAQTIVDLLIEHERSRAETEKN